jgi:hypothetical protein
MRKEAVLRQVKEQEREHNRLRSTVMWGAMQKWIELKRCPICKSGSLTQGIQSWWRRILGNRYILFCSNCLFTHKHNGYIEDDEDR